MHPVRLSSNLVAVVVVAVLAISYNAFVEIDLDWLQQDGGSSSVGITEYSTSEAFFDAIEIMTVPQPILCRSCSTQSTTALHEAMLNTHSEVAVKVITRSVDASSNLFWNREESMPLSEPIMDSHVKRDSMMELSKLLVTVKTTAEEMVYFNDDLVRIPSLLRNTVNTSTLWVERIERSACSIEGELKKNLWISTPNVMVQAHFDTVENVLVQLAGRKRVTLSPQQSTGFTAFPFLHVHSRQNLWPCGVSCDSWTWTVDLGPSDALYIPSGAWHAVAATGDDTSISSSVFCPSQADALSDKLEKLPFNPESDNERYLCLALYLRKCLRHATFDRDRFLNKLRERLSMFTADGERNLANIKEIKSVCQEADGKKVSMASLVSQLPVAITTDIDEFIHTSQDWWNGIDESLRPEIWLVHYEFVLYAAAGFELETFLEFCIVY